MDRIGLSGERSTLRRVAKTGGALATAALVAGCNVIGSGPGIGEQIDPHSVEGLKRRFALPEGDIARINCKTNPKDSKEFEFNDKKKTGAFVIDVLTDQDKHLALYLRTVDGKTFRLESYYDNDIRKDEGKFVRGSKVTILNPHGIEVKIGHDRDKGEEHFVDFGVTC